MAKITFQMSKKQYDSAREELCLLKGARKMSTPTLDSVFNSPRFKSLSIWDRLKNKLFHKAEAIDEESIKKCIRYLITSGYYETSYSLGCALFFYSSTPYYRKSAYCSCVRTLLEGTRVDSIQFLQDVFKLPEITAEERREKASYWLSCDSNRKKLRTYLEHCGFNARWVAGVVSGQDFAPRYKGVYDAIYFYYYKMGMR